MKKFIPPLAAVLFSLTLFGAISALAENTAIIPAPRDANWIKRHEALLEEVKSRKDNVDLLFISTLKPRAIMAGKLQSAVILVLMVFSACAPFMTFTYLLRGLDMPTIAQRYPEQHAQRMAEPYTFRVPGGESYADAAERVRPLLEELQGPTLLVAHGALIRSLLVAIGLASPEVATRMVIHQGRWLELDAAGYAWYSAPGWDAQP